MNERISHDFLYRNQTMCHQKNVPKVIHFSRNSRYSHTIHNPSIIHPRHRNLFDSFSILIDEALNKWQNYPSWKTKFRRQYFESNGSLSNNDDMVAAVTLPPSAGADDFDNDDDDDAQSLW